jgi:hypothetical protein
MFVVATIISIIFLIVKFLEMRYIEKESKPLKFLIRDAFLVYFTVIIGNFVLDQIKPAIKGGSTAEITPVFTDNPGF